MKLQSIAVAMCVLTGTITLAQANTGNLIVGYLDTTATGSAAKVNMQQAATDGYNMVIFGFAKVVGTTIDFFNDDSKKLLQQKLTAAKSAGMKTLVTVGGQANTFIPGTLSSQQITTLATNIVSFLKANNLDGIDFDLEVKTDPLMLDNLLKAIKLQDSSLIITAAPQINAGKFVTTGTDQDYDTAIKDGLFNYLFVQEYNTAPQNDISYISSIYPIIKAATPITTKIVTGEPTAAVAAGAITIYHPTPSETLDTQDVTPQMLTQLAKINTDAQYGGVMGWSLNIDYDAADYSDPNHINGTFAYGLKDCVIDNQCTTPPTPKTPVPNFNLQNSNTDSKIGVIFKIDDSQGDTFTSDYIAPGANKVYNKTSNPSATALEGKKSLSVHWSTYQGGPSGTCPGTFNLTDNMNILVNPSTKACAFKQLPNAS
jgi:chitinase